MNYNGIKSSYNLGKLNWYESRPTPKRTVGQEVEVFFNDGKNEATFLIVRLQGSFVS